MNQKKRCVHLVWSRHRDMLCRQWDLFQSQCVLISVAWATHDFSNHRCVCCDFRGGINQCFLLSLFIGGDHRPILTLPTCLILQSLNNRSCFANLNFGKWMNLWSFHWTCECSISSIKLWQSWSVFLQKQTSIAISFLCSITLYVFFPLPTYLDSVSMWLGRSHFFSSWPRSS
jgi:hypothetical protein